MALKRRRSLGAALVVCAPPLARIHEQIYRALDLVPCEGDEYGKPGGSGLFVSEPRGNLNEVELFALPYFSREWLSKLDDGKSSDKKASETWDRFEKAEASCFDTNQRLARDWRNSPFVREILLAQKIASRVLGKFDWDHASRGFGWGPGSTTRLNRQSSDAAHKYCGNPHATIGNAVLANTVLQWTPSWLKNLEPVPASEGVGYVKIVDGNRVVTVPKNYKTDRTIAIEPDMNIYIQKGIGSVIRTKLRGVGINLDDQTRNQRLAFIGSAVGSLATIDLSMASDTISRSVVELLIRPDWLDALGQCRSPFGVLPSGKKIFYQKYSSMGNGFTFELETLIFWSLAMAYARIHGEEAHRISVYGDDLIVPSTMAERFCGLLQFMGFTPNEKKSYWSGPFRESCGKHYFRGYDVTPFYVKRAPKTLVELFKIHNQIWRFVQRSKDWLDPSRAERLLDVCSWLRGYSPASWRKPSIPDGVGDGAFVGLAFDDVHPVSVQELPKTKRRGWDGFYFRTFVSLPRSDSSFDGPGLLPKSLARLERAREGSKEVTANLDSAYELDRIKGHAVYLVGDEPRDTVEVLPIVGRRYVEFLLFIKAGALRR